MKSTIMDTSFKRLARLTGVEEQPENDDIEQEDPNEFWLEDERLPTFRTEREIMQRCKPKKSGRMTGTILMRCERFLEQRRAHRGQPGEFEPTRPIDGSPCSCGFCTRVRNMCRKPVPDGTSRLEGSGTNPPEALDPHHPDVIARHEQEDLAKIASWDAEELHDQVVDPESQDAESEDQEDQVQDDDPE